MPQLTMHSPTLKTIKMVEDTLKDAGEIVTIAELKRRLPRKVMHQTLLEILDYLQESNRILIGTKGVLYTWVPREEYDRLVRNSTEL